MSLVHGSPSTYTNHQCRCRECQAAWRDYVNKARRTRQQRLAADPTIANHGLDSTYTNWGCRCPKCKAAHTEMRRSQRERTGR